MSAYIIDDNTPIDHFNVNGGPCGCLPRIEPVGGLPFASAPDVTLIPWDEMPDRIADQERNKSSLFHIWQDSKIGVLDQNPLLYCWAFSSTEALMLEREIMGLPFVHLSPSSVACPVVNFSNQGYYIEKALAEMVSTGAASTDFVPETTTNRSDFKVGWKESAACNKVLKWHDVGNDAQTQMSMLLSIKPLVAAHNWWGHAILHLRVRDANPRLKANDINRYQRDFLNSWGKTYGNNGIGTIQGYRAVADNAYAIAQASFVE